MLECVPRREKFVGLCSFSAIRPPRRCDASEGENVLGSTFAVFQFRLTTSTWEVERKCAVEIRSNGSSENFYRG